MSTYLRAALPSPIVDEQIQPNSASRSFASPIYSKKVILEDNTWTTDASAREEYLTGIQEEYFLGMFWQSYHCTYPILDETEFKEHYKSLWVSVGHSRKPSALVDIVLAICMQYGIAFLPRKDSSIDAKAKIDVNDATIAGRWYYHRCQTLLTAELESPSISTLQCHILTVVYLSNASFQNMAHITLATGMRIAQVLGLHLEPPVHMPRAQRELRKRIWWTLYALEVKVCMKFGRPISTQLEDFTCTLPADDREAAELSGSSFAVVDRDVTWLAYGVQVVKFILAARKVYESFYNKCTELMILRDVNSIYSNKEILEEAAEFLDSQIQHLYEWRSNVPTSLQTKRKEEGRSLSTHRTPLEVEQFAPLWLQRQRIFLELLYHNLSMNLHRPFITFTSSTHNSPPITNSNSITCLNHAMSITSIMHQLIIETEILHGWHEAFQWQWNATLSTIGFILAYPNHESVTEARKSIDETINVLELLGNHFAIAASAATVSRDLVAKADFLGNRSVTNMETSRGVDLAAMDGHDVVEQEDGAFLALGSDDFAGSLGFGFSDGFEWLSSDIGSFPDAWRFAQD